MLSPKTIQIVKSTAPVLADKGVEITSYFYKKMFENHPELLNIFNHANQIQGRQQTALANTIYAAANNIDQLEILLPAVKQIAHKHRSLAVKPEHYPIVGEHLLLAIKEVLGAAASDDILQAWEEAYNVIAQVFIDVEKDLYQEAVSQKEGWKNFKTFTVVKKVVESDVITSFYLKPENGSDVPDYLPGQYITIRLSIPGEKHLLNRQYSLSDVSNGNYYRISVKKETANDFPGIVSAYLHDGLQPGDKLEVASPAGSFTLTKMDHEPVCFISGGVGITPMLSMVKTIAMNQPERKTTFIHAAKDGAVHAFYNEVMEAIHTLHDGKAIFVYENPSEKDRLEEKFQYEGYITEEILAGLALQKDASYYVCGPVPFMRKMISLLEKLGVSPENIHYEFFGPAIDFNTQNALTN